MKPFQACGVDVFLQEQTCGTRTSVWDHTLPKHVPSLGFVLAQRQALLLGKTLPKAARNTELVLGGPDGAAPKTSRFG